MGKRSIISPGTGNDAVEGHLIGDGFSAEWGVRKILAISSGGGHWVQLLRVMPAFAGHKVVYVTVDPSYRQQLAGEKFYAVNNATRWNKLGILRLALRIAWIILRERPDVIISTGAAPGFLGILIGKWLKIRTIWIDSIANAERLSMSGERAGRHVDLWLTQWPHLERDEGPRYAGAVL